MPGDLLLEALHRIGPRACQAFVEHARQRVDVRAQIDLAALEPLGRHVGHRAQRAACRRQPLLAGRAGQPEVDQVGEVAVGDQDVGRFDVAVDQAPFVGGVQRGGDLLDHRHRQRRRRAALSSPSPDMAPRLRPSISRMSR